MKISATIKGCVQTGQYTYQDTLQTFVFDSTATIDEILKTTRQDDISICNLAPVKEAAHD